jgi:hypothetical protein
LGVTVMAHAERQTTISAEYSLERILFRLGEDISRLQRQLAILAEEGDAPLRSDTMAVYADMLAQRQALLVQVEAELQARSQDYEAIAL